MKYEPVKDFAERERILALIERCEKEQTMSDDLIKRSDAIKALYKYSFVSKDVIEREIKAIPTADRPRGHWIEQEDCWQCSECGDEYVLEVDVKPIDAKMHFCPNCGARMKGADDE